MGKNTLRVAILNAILLTGGTLAYAETAYAQGQTQTYSIEAGDLESVLSRFGTQSRIQLIYPPDLLKGKRSNGLTGNHTPTEALRRLLEGSGLEAERVNDSTVVIKRASVPVASQPQAATRNPPATAQSDEAEVQELERLTVTGTRIRGGVTASPTITVDEVQFRQEGFTDLGEVIRAIPQNYRGGQNPGVTSGGSLGGTESNTNVTGGSALNLRGLGPDATLTLLNGRRLSYDGISQAVDISAIPIAAVARVEVVPDGASAIYGSDAVAGVANVVLMRDFDGVALEALYGDSADGGLTRHDYSVTAGTTWNSGGLIATFKKSDADPIYADQRDYTQSMDDPTTIYLGSSLRSGLISAHQSLGDVAELRLDALRTEREQTRYTGSPTFYDFSTPESTVTLVAPSLQMLLPGDWSLLAGVSRSKGELAHKNTRVSGGISTLQTSGCYCNETEAWELGAEGPLFRWGQREVRLAAGVGGRTTEFLTQNFVSGTSRGGDEGSLYAYSEVSLPVVGADNARPGVRRLELSAAVRSEDYETFGGVTTPKLGVIYDPNADFTLKASWGRSFKAPTLVERYAARDTYLMLAAAHLGCTSCAADDTVLMSLGGNADLEPERARTWSASLAFHPEKLPGLDVELTYFSIDYNQRVMRPVTNYIGAMGNPTYTEFFQHNPSSEDIERLISTYNDAFINGTGSAYDPSNVVAILTNHYINIARQRVHGVDLTGSYRFDLASGRLDLRGGASWLDLSRQNSPGQEEFDLAGMIFQPAELNARFGVAWSRGGFSMSAFANYTSGVTSELTATPEKTASFTTFDTTLRYETASTGSPLSGLTLALSVDNVFNRAPPLYVSPSIRYAPYDSTNYSAIGRYVTVSLSKHW